MLKYCTRLILVIIFVSQNIHAQQNALSTKKDSLQIKNVNYHPKTYGLRLGVDIIKPILSYTQEDFKGIEIVGDWRLNTRLFIAGELGYSDKTIDEENFNHTVTGQYVKAGLNYNLYTNWLNMDNELYVGFRYGFSNFSNQLNHYTIFQEGTYFPIREINDATKFEALNAHWVELVAGVKVEVISNLYLGFMINISKIITTKEPNNFENTYSPGFGSISQNGNGSNINYTISYRIPIYKK
ncbi:DUF6048 family protein [Wenyingzhuangia sp. IMCC45533]